MQPFLQFQASTPPCEGVVKNRIVITIVALVILPTALLSIMAGRAVHNRELVIMQQMKISANSMLRLSSEEIESGMKDELSRIASAVGATLMRTASAAQLSNTADNLEQTSQVVDGVIVYHDPWETIYPTRRNTPTNEAPQLSFVEPLRVEIASRQSAPARDQRRTALPVAGLVLPRPRSGSLYSYSHCGSEGRRRLCTGRRSTRAPLKALLGPLPLGYAPSFRPMCR